MDNKENKYLEIAVGSPRNRNIAIPYSKITDYIKDEPLFRSYYYYDQTLVEHLEAGHTVKSFKGVHYFDRAVLDIDKGSDSHEEVLKRTSTFIQYCLEGLSIPEDCINVWYSGTGYHVLMPDIWGFTASVNLPEIVKSTFSHYFPEADNIYDPARLIRVGLTPNEKTRNKRYKVPIPLNDVIHGSYKDILKKSESVENIEIPVFPEGEVILPIEMPKTKEKSLEPTRHDPTTNVTCIQKMIAEGPIRGSRHKKMNPIVSHYKKVGQSEDFIIAGMKEWAHNMAPGEVEYSVRQIFNAKDGQGYNYGCLNTSGMMHQYCDPKCRLYPFKMQGKDMLAPPMSNTEMESVFRKRIRMNLGKNAIHLDKMFNLKEHFKIMPSEFVVVFGDTGMGKTAFVQNLVLNTSLPTLWLSLEVDDTLMYRRFVQIAMGKNKNEVIDHYLDNENSWSKAMEHIRLVTIPPTQSGIIEMMSTFPAKVVVVDTLHDMQTPRYVGSDIVHRTDDIVDSLRSISTLHDIIVIAVVHIPKSVSLSGQMTVHSAKGSSSVAQKADRVIAISGESSRNTVRKISALKARDDQLVDFYCDFNFDTFRFIPNSQQGHNESKRSSLSMRPKTAQAAAPVGGNSSAVTG